MNLRRLCCSGMFTFAVLPFTLADAAERPTVVELYTSEGCSSCPPAEAYLGELARRPDVLALAFHVDYWDDLGWRDPWAQRLFTSRQSLYVRQLSLGSAFTPQAIVDGSQSFVGSDRSGIGAQLGKSSAEVPVSVVRDQETLLISVGAQSQPTDVVLIPFRHHALRQSEVGQSRP